MMKILWTLWICGIARAIEYPSRQSDETKMFLCYNRFAIEIAGKCNGVNDCKDGSDENPQLCATDDMTLLPGKSIDVEVQTKETHNGVLFLLCDTRECSKLLIRQTAVTDMSYTARAPFFFQSGMWCNRMGFFCKTPRNPDHGKGFSGRFSFKVERSNAEMKVMMAQADETWLRASVKADARKVILKVRPHTWTSDILVDFNGGNTEADTGSPGFHHRW